MHFHARSPEELCQYLDELSVRLESLEFWIMTLIERSNPVVPSEVVEEVAVVDPVEEVAEAVEELAEAVEELAEEVAEAAEEEAASEEEEEENEEPGSVEEVDTGEEGTEEEEETEEPNKRGSRGFLGRE